MVAPMFPGLGDGGSRARKDRFFKLARRHPTALPLQHTGSENNVRETRSDMSKVNRSHGIWVQPDVFGLFSGSVGSFSANVGLRAAIFSLNVGMKVCCSRAGHLYSRAATASPWRDIARERLSFQHPSAEFVTEVRAVSVWPVCFLTSTHLRTHTCRSRHMAGRRTWFRLCGLINHDALWKTIPPHIIDNSLF
jgi:hypothetical protein